MTGGRRGDAAGQEPPGGQEMATYKVGELRGSVVQVGDGNTTNVVLPSREAVEAFFAAQKISTEVSFAGPGGIQAGKAAGAKDIAASKQAVDTLLSSLDEASAQAHRPLEDLQVGDEHLTRADLLLRKGILLLMEAEYAQMAAGVGPMAPTEGRMDPAILSNAREARDHLAEAWKLDPESTLIPLNLARAYLILTPDDPSDELRLLDQVRRKLAKPANDEERFQLAMANLLIAYSSQDAVPALDARRILESLDLEPMVAVCDALIASLAPGAGEKGLAPLPSGFPAGRWDIRIMDLVNSSMHVDFRPDGSFTARQTAASVGFDVSFSGTWRWTPETRTVHMQGQAGSQSVVLPIAILGPKGDVLWGLGTMDGFGYLWSRAA